MAQSGYFDIHGDYGFTQRTHWRVENDTLVVTGVQMQSANHDKSWYPGGDISVNSIPVFRMNYMNPATHVYHFPSAGETFVDITRINDGQSLPAASGIISDGKAVVQVDVELYDDNLKIWPRIKGSVEVNFASLLAVVHDGSEFRQKQVIAHSGAGFRKYLPIVHDGAGWKN